MLSGASPRIIATLDKLDSVEWFRRVGDKDQSNVDFVESWTEAIQHCASGDWESLTMEAANQLRERIFEVNKERLNKWNEIRDVVKPFSDALVSDKIGSVTQSKKLPQVFADCVRWDIFHLCMEAEYSDIVKPGFFASLSYYYVSGHFPCGFSGDFPNGRFVIY
ncbi:hypothetical protein [Rhizobium oryzicola]|uniref:Uncharacterized protein n=1 Tax=Rhizobium oryzicola TaxID=1232668 RepID=A0ABT8SXC5_9HYPH|nr:hypothetical protein [Rhizobium oryzicola]MDO1583075.1 hypothetical protein [Rhizobium oryzicola]